MIDHSTTVPANLVLECVQGRRYGVAKLTLREDGRVIVSEDVRVGGDMTPIDVYHRRDLVWQIASARNGSCAVDVEALRDDLAEGGVLSRLLDRVRAGHSIEWDGSNMVGRLTDDAEEAREEISYLIAASRRYASDTMVMSAEEWLCGQDDGGVVLGRLEISVDATAEQISDCAAECVAQAEMDGIILTGDMAEVIRSVIAEAREDIAA